MITSIAFLPIQDITAGIHAVETVLPAELHPVLDWLVLLTKNSVNYSITGFSHIMQVGLLGMGGRTQPLFDPEMWSVHERTLLRQDRTNNYAEAHHRRLQNAFKCDHPPIWRLIDKLREEQKQIDANLASFLAGRDPHRKKAVQ